MEAPLLSEQEPPSFRWQRMDLVAFAAFFLAVVAILPAGIFLILRLLRPGLQVADLSGVEQILIQAFMDIVLVGFIFFLIKVLHGRPIRESLHWASPAKLPVGSLIAGGAFLALTVLIASMVFPPPTESPLEKLLTTTESIVVFVVFGIALAPLLEEIIFRGFIYTLLADVYSPKVAVPVTAVLFAGLHLSQLRGNLPAVLLILFVGYVLTVVRMRSNSLIPSVIMHTAYNAMIFGIAALSTLVDRSTKT
jgi:membrane protease YdiL (CAAX protease family)